MFGAAQQNKPAFGGSLFGQPQQQTGAGFGGLGNSTQQNLQTGGLFGGLGQNAQAQQPQQQTSGFSGGFGQSIQNQQQQGGLFGGLGATQQQTQPVQSNSLFGGLGQQNQQQGGFGQSTQQQGLGQSQQGFSTSLWQPNQEIKPHEKSIPEQMTAIMDQWDMNSPNCGFKYYFYNRVDDEVKASLAKPAAYEDPKAWDEALKNKPGPRHIPALCVGFDQLGQRIILQQKTVNAYNSALHSINDSLTALLQKHDTQMSIRAMDAKRKHNTIKQRCLALATKVQILQNRGYQLGGVEEDLKIKLMALDKGVSDPGLGARAEEIWARMITVQERAKLLKNEIEKAGTHSDIVLDEETDQRAKKILEDYQTQLVHLKSELDKIQKDYVEWEKQQPEAQKPNGR